MVGINAFGEKWFSLFIDPNDDDSDYIMLTGVEQNE